MRYSFNITINTKGLTLIQLLIVIVIISILATITYAGFHHFIKLARLNEAKSILLNNQHILTQHYQKNLTYKVNSTTWIELPIKENDHFCFRLIGNPQGAPNDKYRLKAVAINSQYEPRIVKINQDSTVIICESSTSLCSETNHFF